ncbi:uncharacterized protein LOC126895545 isoform X5 [Daktulosphaira vitifoliae]|uniref:uncharacterized protein LOC126895545 isoform X5 n=1 Tax=Daktulosphaira vitifoliae TaxID=58002 RepID=UPI0021A9FF5E|nr:uncharacterized protein LOC126895545 isoform X5 [Daktulosphaira vitifoliae]
MNLYIFSNKKIKMQIYKIVLFSAFMFILLNETYASYSQNSNPEDDLAAKVSHDSSSSGNEYLSKTKTAANIIAEQTKKTLSSESVQKMKNRIAKVVNSTTNYVTKKNKNQEK